jgi:hypothetical protein
VTEVITIVDIYQLLQQIFGVIEDVKGLLPAPGPVEGWWAVPFTEYSVTEGLLFMLVCGLFAGAIFKIAWRCFTW